ncbi:MAG: UDP-N-acetylmuramate:L-alanyl-gamma-D-glutamyl-meso-diaminopimelate ligase [Gammaproteobacteria bacterium]|nr:UDP-N-acetylmuramate:L-alanyl-gamma-D-glutamyl-meso-diaminopimelate ligase [Gammaproteobacteria bacterium]MCY4211357.1 UDP-N-acetylmuramate:L-alanyl-gamma-D-glutamyl-meso-diaminopimelate ligase [Gammaproteobacteria bacterium]MCY4282421.1 UDP-N-acetylmuramate:L-alanyl-gamma-D-glutamyl-meso-diaminopimelate ligase [Gammaproteobacteria bacterium]
MNLHLLGICGTFMGGLARLAQQLGHRVTGTDQNVYPPMSDELARAGIAVHQGYEPDRLDPRPDLVIIGNALARGNPCVEYVLAQKLPYTSGPQWLAQNVLPGRTVLAVAGTHGKTTTASILAWLLHDAGLNPGFLIGGAPENFEYSATLGDSGYFVVEADEYDTAFFDKRSKFIHYRPDILVINNLEYDHADIFAGIEEIQRQFHHLLRTVPGNGQVIVRDGNAHINALLDMGTWSPLTRFGEASAAWHTVPNTADYAEFQVIHADQDASAQEIDPREVGKVRWSLFGRHNADNALAALLAAQHVGIPITQGCASLSGFNSVKRRLQLLATVNGISVYDDFAHHPTAIKAALQALRGRIGGQPLIAVLELRSNTMKAGIHKHTLAGALNEADLVCVLEPPGLGWDLHASLRSLGDRLCLLPDVAAIVEHLQQIGKPGAHILIMSNGGFDRIYQRLLERLSD